MLEKVTVDVELLLKVVFANGVRAETPAGMIIP
jgi:hypothetical protein